MSVYLSVCIDDTSMCVYMCLLIIACHIIDNFSSISKNKRIFQMYHITDKTGHTTVYDNSDISVQLMTYLRERGQIYWQGQI